MATQEKDIIDISYFVYYPEKEHYNNCFTCFSYFILKII